LNVLQLYETMQLKHGVMVYGESCSGKTTLISSLYESLMRAREDEIKYECQKYKAKKTIKVSESALIEALLNPNKPASAIGLSN